MIPGSPPRVVGVARLAQRIKRMFDDEREFVDLHVRGEISNFTPHRPSGNCYFKLKEGTALLDCVAWRDVAAALPPLHDGMRVVARGTVTTYESASRYQLKVAAVRPQGRGELYLALEELKARLEAEGAFAVARKRALPPVIFRTALVSSPSADGAIDFRTVLAREATHVTVIDVPTPVQGDQAPPRIAAAIARAAALDVDVVVVVRGGGSFEDLYAFNAESVVRAILASPVPVVTGIGHESDTTLADLAADVRAATPTDAAGRMGSTTTLRRRIGTLRGRLAAGCFARLNEQRVRVNALERRLDRRSPLAQLARQASAVALLRGRADEAMRRRSAERRERLSRATEALHATMRAKVDRLHRRLAVANATLAGRDPEAILELGYAIVTLGDRVVRDASTVAPGETITARLAAGTLAAKVVSAELSGDDVRDKT